MAIDQYDVLNRFGEPTHKALPKDEVHRRGLWHGGVHIWPTDGRRVLLARRDPAKALMGGKLDIIAGHIAAGERPVETALRELREEGGIDAAEDQLYFFATTPTDMSVRGWPENHRAFDYNFVWRPADLTAVLQEFVPEAGSILAPSLVEIPVLMADMSDPRRASEYALRDPLGPALFVLGATAMQHFGLMSPL
jgi:8-oxo-dGTP pyrophosphatase MutT (NUDIX family)